MDKQGIKNLKKRYLLWFYKTTKEALDRIERKFTQLEIDKFVLKELKKSDKSQRLSKFIGEFSSYIAKKEEEGKRLKYRRADLSAEYKFLVLKLQAIEKAIIKELGKTELNRIKALYEKEMAQRILKSTEHL